MSRSASRVSREWLRATHLATAVMLAAYLYTPLGEVGAARIAIRFVVIPLVALTGVVMWKLPVLRRRWRHRLAATATNA